MGWKRFQAGSSGAAAGGGPTFPLPTRRLPTASGGIVNPRYGLPGWAQSSSWIAGFSLTAGYTNYTPIYAGTTFGIDRLVCEVTTAGAGLARMGLYDAAGNDSRPLNRLLDAGTVDISTTGTKETGAFAYTLAAGSMYWIAFVANIAVTCAAPREDRGAVPVFLSMALGSNASLGQSHPTAMGRTADVAGGLPATVPELTTPYGGLTRLFPYVRFVTT